MANNHSGSDVKCKALPSNCPQLFSGEISLLDRLPRKCNANGKLQTGSLNRGLHIVPLLAALNITFCLLKCVSFGWADISKTKNLGSRASHARAQLCAEALQQLGHLDLRGAKAFFGGAFRRFSAVRWKKSGPGRRLAPRRLGGQCRVLGNGTNLGIPT